MDTNSPIQVECYSGHAYAQEPRAILGPAGRLEIVEVLTRWREPAGPSFRVLAEDQAVYEIVYDEAAGQWHSSLLRQAAAESHSVPTCVGARRCEERSDEAISV